MEKTRREGKKEKRENRDGRTIALIERGDEEDREKRREKSEKDPKGIEFSDLGTRCPSTTDQQLYQSYSFCYFNHSSVDININIRS